MAACCSLGSGYSSSKLVVMLAFHPIRQISSTKADPPCILPLHPRLDVPLICCLISAFYEDNAAVMLCLERFYVFAAQPFTLPPYLDAKVKGIVRARLKTSKSRRTLKSQFDQLSDTKEDPRLCRRVHPNAYCSSFSRG